VRPPVCPIETIRRISGVIIDKESLSARRSTCCAVTLYNANPFWAVLEFNPVHSGEEPRLIDLAEARPGVPLPRESRKLKF